MASVEVELPHILAHGVSPDAAAGAVADVVINLAVVNHRSVPLIIAAAVSFCPCTSFYIRFLTDKVIYRDGVHYIRIVFDYLS